MTDLTAKGLRGLYSGIRAQAAAACMEAVIADIAARTDAEAVSDPHLMNAFYHRRFEHYAGEALELCLRGDDALLFASVSGLESSFRSTPALMFTCRGQRMILDAIAVARESDPAVASLLQMTVLDHHDLGMIKGAE